MQDTDRGLPMQKSAAELLEMYFLEMRSALLETAAAMDRLDRAQGDVTDDPRVENLRQACAIVCSDAPGRAERLQLLFSDPVQ